MCLEKSCVSTFQVFNWRKKQAYNNRILLKNNLVCKLQRLVSQTLNLS